MMGGPIVHGLFGGVVVDALLIVEAARAPKLKRPDFKYFPYLLQYLIWPALGGFLVYLFAATFSSYDFPPLLAFYIGLSAPATVRAWAGTALKKPYIDPGKGA